MSEAVLEQREAQAAEAAAADNAAKRGRTPPRKSYTEAMQDVAQVVAARNQFRRQAALEILGAYVARHGGFSPSDREAILRTVWDYATHFVDLEHAPPLPPPEEFNVLASVSRPAPGGRAAHPADEWAVYDGGRRYAGFVSRQDAEFFAVARPGSKVVQVGGPGAHQGVVADPNVEG